MELGYKGRFYVTVLTTIGCAAPLIVLICLVLAKVNKIYKNLLKQE